MCLPDIEACDLRLKSPKVDISKYGLPELLISLTGPVHKDIAEVTNNDFALIPSR